MLKYLTNQLIKCQESLRKQLFNENKGGRLAFLTDIQLFDLITSGYDIRSLSTNLSFVIPGLKNLLFSEENKGQAIGLITEYQNETIHLLNVRNYIFRSNLIFLSNYFRKFYSKEISKHLFKN